MKRVLKIHAYFHNLTTLHEACKDVHLAVYLICAVLKLFHDFNFCLARQEKCSFSRHICSNEVVY